MKKGIINKTKPKDSNYTIALKFFSS